MKVFLELPVQSRGIGRVRDALERYAPSNIEIVKDASSADLEIIHVIGRRKHVLDRVNHLVFNKRKYAMIQYCLKSTMNTSVHSWIDMWRHADLVWSYYNLEHIANEELGRSVSFPFYYAPLGVDADVFKDYTLERTYTILASGQHALAEGVRECAIATKEVSGKMVHLGHELRRGNDISCISGINDIELAKLYSQCQFVSGLRRIEGFELPVIEGLLCGARPIVYDRPEMRKWFGEFAVFIKEGPREEVIELLTDIFETARDLPQAMRVTPKEKAIAINRFNWQDIISGFWERILQ